MNRISPPAWALVAGLVLLLAACTGGGTVATSAPAEASASEAASAADGAPSEAPGAGDEETAETVTLENFAFAPAELTIPAGTTVSFVNEDQAPHTATHGSDGQAESGALFDLQLPAGDGSGDYTFDEPGTYNVTCTIHPQMNMVVIVE